MWYIPGIVLAGVFMVYIGIRQRPQQS